MSYNYNKEEYAAQPIYPQGAGYGQQPGYPAAPMGGMGPGVPLGFGGMPMAGGASGMPGGYGGGMPPPMGFHMPMAPDQHQQSSSGGEPPKYTGHPDQYQPEFGGMGESMDFSERSIRMAFIRKVYSILSIQLALTTGLIALFVFHEGAKAWVVRTPAFYWSSYVIAIVLLFAIACCENLRRKAPTNFILLALFTLTYGVVIGVVCTQYNVKTVVLAAGTTVIICLALTLFSFQTKWDFTVIGGSLYVCVIIFFIFGLIMIFIPRGEGWSIANMIYAGLGAMLFSVYLVYDTQLMMGGKHKYSISPEEYIFASLNLYTDVIMIFLMLLRLFGSRD